MTKQLSQLDRALRFVLCVRGTPDGSVAILRGDDLLDAKAIAEEFERLLQQSVQRAEHARRIGKERGGRPKSKKPSPMALAKRESRKRIKLKQQKPE